MKTLVPALLLSAAIPILGQSVPQPLTDPNTDLGFPQQFRFNSQDLTGPRAFRFDKGLKVLPLPQILPPPKLGLAEPQLDPKIIRRPPQIFAQQDPRTPLGSDLYTDLKLLPTETARLEPIPVYFPKFKVEPIPLASPEAKMIPVKRVGDTPPTK